MKSAVANTHEVVRDLKLQAVRSVLILGDLARCAIIGEALGALRERAIVATSTLIVMQYASETADPVVILDTSMNDVWNAAEEIRAGFPSAIIYVLIDSDTGAERRKRAASLKIECLSKPFNATRFRLQIQAHLNAVKA